MDASVLERLRAYRMTHRKLVGSFLQHRKVADVQEEASVLTANAPRCDENDPRFHVLNHF